MSAPLGMQQTAAEVGLSYERFRKVWRQLPGFPCPVQGRKWDADAVAAWKAARSRPAGPQAVTRFGPAPGPQRLNAQRAILQQLRAG